MDQSDNESTFLLCIQVYCFVCLTSVHHSNTVVSKLMSVSLMILTKLSLTLAEFAVLHVLYGMMLDLISQIYIGGAILGELIIYTV